MDYVSVQILFNNKLSILKQCNMFMKIEMIDVFDSCLVPRYDNMWNKIRFDKTLLYLQAIDKIDNHTELSKDFYYALESIEERRTFLKKVNVDASYFFDMFGVAARILKKDNHLKITLYGKSLGSISDVERIIEDNYHREYEILMEDPETVRTAQAICPYFRRINLIDGFKQGYCKDYGYCVGNSRYIMDNIEGPDKRFNFFKIATLERKVAECIRKKGFDEVKSYGEPSD